MYDKVELRVLVLATAPRSSGLDRRLSYASCRLIVLAGRVRGVACKEKGAVVPSCVRVCFGYKPRSRRKVHTTKFVVEAAGIHVETGPLSAR